MNTRPPAPPAHPAIRQFFREGGASPACPNGWSPSTRRVALNTLNRWAAFLAARRLDDGTVGVDVLDATRADVVAFRDAALDAGRAATTVVSQLRHIRGFYAWAATPADDDGPGFVARNPAVGRGIFPKAGETRMTTVSAADVESMIRRCDRSTETGLRDAAVLTLLYWGGLRRGEIAALNLDDYVADVDRPMLAIGSVYSPTKTGLVRDLPLARPAMRAIDRYLVKRGRADGPLFVAITATGRLTPSGVSQIVDRARRRTGIERPIGVHEFRRAFSIECKRKGVSDASLMVLTGWTDPNMVARYTRAARAELAHAEFLAVFDADDRRKGGRPRPGRRAA